LHRHLRTRLPDYARPLFVRLCERIAATGTFKLSKAALAREGFADNAAGEACFFDDRAAGRYVAMDDDLRQRIAVGMRLS
jgi:fatty-acyl-CoA synthase